MSAAHRLGALALIAALAAAAAPAQTRDVARPPERPAVEHAVYGERGARTAEVSTAELREILATRTAVLIDVRPRSEYASGHIPGAYGISSDLGSGRNTADVVGARQLAGNRTDSALVLYGNGPFDARVRWLADTLAAIGFTRVGRYQLGVGLWRVLGGVTQIEDDGMRRVADRDQDAVWVDARDSIRWAARTIRGAINIPRVRMVTVRDSLDVSRLRIARDRPAYDHDARVVVFGADSSEARTVAEGLARQGFRNVSFYGGTFLAALVATGR